MAHAFVHDTAQLPNVEREPLAAPVPPVALPAPSEAPPSDDALIAALSCASFDQGWDDARADGLRTKRIERRKVAHAALRARLAGLVEENQRLARQFAIAMEYVPKPEYIGHRRRVWQCQFCGEEAPGETARHIAHKTNCLWSTPASPVDGASSARPEGTTADALPTETTHG